MQARLRVVLVPLELVRAAGVVGLGVAGDSTEHALIGVVDGIDRNDLIEVVSVQPLGPACRTTVDIGAYDPPGNRLATHLNVVGGRGLSVDTISLVFVFSQQLAAGTVDRNQAARPSTPTLIVPGSLHPVSHRVKTVRPLAAAGSRHALQLAGGIKSITLRAFGDHIPGQVVTDVRGALARRVARQPVVGRVDSQRCCAARGSVKTSVYFPKRLLSS